MEIYRIENGDSPAWLYKAYDYVRMDAFVIGQGIPPEMEFGHDGPEEELEAVVLTEDSRPAAGCRITYPREGTAKIERVCVVRDRQKHGLGRVLLKEAETWIREKGISHIVINSQDRAAAFYEKCGYRPAPELDPEIYGNAGAAPPSGGPADLPGRAVGTQNRVNLGFSCVLVEKYINNILKQKDRNP